MRARLHATGVVFFFSTRLRVDRIGAARSALSARLPAPKRAEVRTSAEASGLLRISAVCGEDDSRSPGHRSWPQWVHLEALGDAVAGSPRLC